MASHTVCLGTPASPAAPILGISDTCVRQAAESKLGSDTVPPKCCANTGLKITPVPHAGWREVPTRPSTARAFILGPFFHNSDPAQSGDFFPRSPTQSIQCCGAIQNKPDFDQTCGRFDPFGPISNQDCLHGPIWHGLAACVPGRLKHTPCGVDLKSGSGSELPSLKRSAELPAWGLAALSLRRTSEERTRA